jgi:hypothetical protein
VLAGLLGTERDEITATLAALGFRVASERTENEWWGCVARAAD